MPCHNGVTGSWAGLQLTVATLAAQLRPLAADTLHAMSCQCFQNVFSWQLVLTLLVIVAVALLVGKSMWDETFKHHKKVEGLENRNCMTML